MTVPTFAALIDWDADGAYTDEVSRLVGFTVRRGRQSTLYGTEGYTYVQAGEFSLVLNDRDHRYDPFNTGSALYPDVKPHRKFKLQAVYGGLTYNLITGFVRDIRPQSMRSEALVEGKDGIDWLGQQKCARGSLQTDYAVSSAIDDLVSDAGWPFASSSGWIFPETFPMILGGSGIENNGDLLPYWWADPEKSVWQALTELAKAFAGDVFVASDGTFSYNARLYAAAPKLTISQVELLKDIELQQPWEEMRNDIAVTAFPRQATAANTEIWRLNDIPLIGAGATLTIYANFQYQGERIPASSVTTPASTTDYTANTLENGSGTDKTAQVAIVMTTYASSAKLEITNNDAAAVYLTLMKLRGTGLYAQSGVTALASDSTSQTAYGKLSLKIESIWLQEAQEAKNHADYAEVIYTADRRVAWVRIEQRPELQFGVDLFDVVTIDIDELGIDGRYFVTYIEHAWKAGEGCVTTWRIEPTPGELVAGIWTFPVTWNDNNMLLW